MQNSQQKASTTPLPQLKAVIAPLLPESLKHLFRSEDPALQVSLEEPRSLELTGSTVTVSGWASCRSDRELTGVVTVNRQHEFELEMKDSRPDVVQALGTVRRKVRGWNAEIPWRTYLEAPEQSVLELSLKISDGQTTQIFGPLYCSKSKTLPQLTSCIESPQQGQAFAQAVELRGWAIGPKDESISGRVLAFGKEVERFYLDQLRADVVQAYGLPSSNAAVGFALALDWSSLPHEEGRTDITIELTHAEGKVEYGPISVVRGETPLPRHSRGDYKEVWNKASEDHTGAMLAVAGIADYTEFFESGVSSAQTIRETMKISACDRVLEIGCGTGRIGKALAPSCKEWVGCDISGHMLAFAKENLKDTANVTLVELAGAALREFADASFDHVYCSAVFMHLEEWDRYRYVTEAFRVLKPSGTAYIDNMNLAGDAAWSVFSQLAALDPLTRLPQISKTSTAEELTTYLRRAGFTEIRERREPLLVTAWGMKPR